jgi:hypothetical protein
MMLRKIPPMFVTALVICSCAAYADSLPIAGAVAQVSTTVHPLSWTQVSGTSGSSTGTESSASIDMTTGQLRVATSGSDLPYAGVQGFEFLQFSGSGTISYNFAISGTLSNSNPTGAVRIGSSAIFYDVNGLSPNYFANGGLPGFDFVDAAAISFATNITYDYGSSFNISNIPPTNANFIQNNDGSAIPVLVNLSGSFDVQSGQLYAIALQLVGSEAGANSSNSLQAADFSHTGTFQFTDLDGLTFTSSSGEFLSNAAVVTTPEPSSFVLLALALTLTGAWRARRSCSRERR